MSENVISLASLEPAREDLAELLEETRALITRYVVLPSAEAADAVTLYAAATFAARNANTAPRLIVRSPEKRCGKSRLIVDVLGNLVCHPVTAVSISPAALVHSIDPDNPPTIILDEADTIFGKRSSSDEGKTELLRGVLNSGFSRGAPYVRWDAQARKMDECPTFAMAIIGGIDNGHMPDTIEDRAVIITLRRKLESESVQRFRIVRDGPKVRAMGERLALSIVPLAAELAEAEPDLPDELNDRAQDVWEPLLALADRAGRDWPERARKAALVLSAGAEEEDPAEVTGRRLLRDIESIWMPHVDSMATESIIQELCKLEDAPWATYDRGGKIRGLDIGSLLRPYHIRSKDIRIGGVVKKGFRREWFEDAWARYPRSQEASGEADGRSIPGATRQQPATPVTSQVSPVAGTKIDPQRGGNTGQATNGVAGPSRVRRGSENAVTREVASVAGRSGVAPKTDQGNTTDSDDFDPADLVGVDD